MKGVEDVNVLLADRLAALVLLALPRLLHHLDVRLVSDSRDEEIMALGLLAPAATGMQTRVQIEGWREQTWFESL